MKITDGLTGRGRPLLLHVREAAVNAPPGSACGQLIENGFYRTTPPPKPPMIFDRMGKEEIGSLVGAAE